MKITCDITKDLLPLYCDGVCSDESKEVINDHLANCEICKEELRLMDIPSETSQINIEDEKVIEASAKAWKKRKYQSFIFGCLVALLVVGLGVGSYVGVHWFSTADENNIEALAQQAGDYFDDAAAAVLEVEQRGNYLAVLYKSENGNIGMCVFDRDNLFGNRWKASGGKPSFSQGEILSWSYGSPDREAVLIFCGANISEKAKWYTFQNSNVTYICPIEKGEVLDVFVIPDSKDINGSPVLLDSNRQEIE